MTEWVRETGGQRTLPASYDSVRHKACPKPPLGCGAEPDAVCTFVDGRGETRPRHLPCISRLCQGAS